MKLRVQAQHLKAGDIVGSGETIMSTILNSVSFPSSKIAVHLQKNGTDRWTYWGKYTMINVERKENEN